MANSFEHLVNEIGYFRPTNGVKYMTREQYDAYYERKGELFIRRAEQLLRRPGGGKYELERYPGQLLRRLRKARGVGQVKNINPYKNQDGN